MILSAIREALEQKRKAREAFQHLSIPQAVCYLAADQMTRPGTRRAARWAMSQYGGGMYCFDPEEEREIAHAITGKKPKILIPGKTDAFGDPIDNNRR